MTLSFANPHVAEKCRILAGMEPGKWYELETGSAIWRLRFTKFLHRKGNQYILTPSGEKMSALLKHLGAK
jgi:hypothetical protein